MSAAAGGGAVATRIANGAALGALLASGIAWLAPWAWIGELLVHFRLQYLAIALGAALVLALRRAWRGLAVAIVAALLDLAPAWDYFAPPRAAPVPELASAGATSFAADAHAPVTLRIGSANVFFMNHAHAKVLAWVRRARPEVVVFIEVTPEWRAALAPLAAEYPYEVFASDRSHHAVLLRSRWPLEAPGPLAGDGVQRAALLVDVVKQGAPLRIAAMHAAWPVTPAQASLRATDFAVLAQAARQRGARPFVAVGDLNCSPFSPQFARLLADGGLRRAAQGRGWLPTWPTFLPPVGIQIDHALLSPEVQLRGFALGSGTGSDHRPIVADIAFAAPLGQVRAR
ncbi:MAG: endonuclease/exonuclease/phosphatase family protein [Steroidobacteraceae bacterium]